MFYFLEIIFHRLIKQDIIYKIKEPRGVMKRISSIDEFIKIEIPWIL